MTRYGMVVDTTRCNGCYNCFLACKDEYCGNDYPPFSAAQPEKGQFWMRVIERERGKYPQAIKVVYIPTPCMHCDEAPCIKAATNGEIYRQEEGIVIIDPIKSKGKKDLIASCPYRVIYWNEATQIPQKCTFCAHLINNGWKEPRCVEACPTGALIFGDIDDSKSEVARLIAAGKTEILHPEYEMQDKVSFIGLPKRFIAGSVIFGDTDECAKNVTVTIKSENLKKVIKTNNFGDFELDGLPAETKHFVQIESSGYRTANYDVITKTDIYLGDIILKKRPS
jgi:Fe-S-cluster-containing dehydrogenase component